MRDLRVQFISANVLSHQRGSHFDLSCCDSLSGSRGLLRLSPLRKNLRFGFDTDERDQVTPERATPIEQAVVAVKLGVVDRISFACERVSQITVSREQRRLGGRIALRQVTPPP